MKEVRLGSKPHPLSMDVQCVEHTHSDLAEQGTMDISEQETSHKDFTPTFIGQLFSECQSRAGDRDVRRRLL